MTGYGMVECKLPFGDALAIVEIKTLNSKNLDLSLKLPQDAKKIEPILRKMASERLLRGKIDTQLRIELPTIEVRKKSINREAVSAYMSELASICPEMSASKLLEISLSLPESVCAAAPQEAREIGEDLYIELFQKALDEVVAFRQREGKSLEDDILKRIHLIGQLSESLTAFEPLRVNRVKERLQATLSKLNVSIDANRLEQELIYYLEKMDITEEKTRLKAHLDYFVSVVEGEDQPGRKLGFIAQEIGREVNTIGSKSNDAEMQKKVVLMKDELEKVKEQLLNIL